MPLIVVPVADVYVNSGIDPPTLAVGLVDGPFAMVIGVAWQILLTLAF